ncbi:MAG: helix-turn-helix transcriptional regulator [Chitinophagales bacterium]
MDSITHREMEILQLIAIGLTSGEIAKKLFISKNTVETHRKNLLGKLNVKNTAALLKYLLIKTKFAFFALKVNILLYELSLVLKSGLADRAGGH